MATDFIVKSIPIPSGTGPRTITGSVTFPSSVNRAAVALNGFKMDFVNEDHNINIIEVDADKVSISGYTVTFQVQCDYADKSFNDPYQGYVSVLVIADVT